MLSFSFPYIQKKKKKRKLLVIFQHLPGFCGYELLLESSTRSSGDLNTLSLWSSVFLFLYKYGIRNNHRQADGLLKIYLGIACIRICYSRCSVVVFVMVLMVFLNFCFQAWIVQMKFRRRLAPLSSTSWGCAPIWHGCVSTASFLTFPIVIFFPNFITWTQLARSQPGVARCGINKGQFSFPAFCQ